MSAPSPSVSIASGNRQSPISFEDNLLSLFVSQNVKGISINPESFHSSLDMELSLLVSTCLTNASTLNCFIVMPAPGGGVSCARTGMASDRIIKAWITIVPVRILCLLSDQSGLSYTIPSKPIYHRVSCILRILHENGSFEKP